MQHARAPVFGPNRYAPHGLKAGCEQNTLLPMSDEAIKPGGGDRDREAYAAAVLAFNAASAVLILRLAANALPTDDEIAAEESARAAVVATRRTLWAKYARENPA